MTLEQLEARQLLATVTWEGDVDANWLGGTAGVNTNWVGNVLPQPGDSLVFPAGAGNLTNNNDSPAGTEYSISFTGTGYVVGGNQIELNGVTGISNSGAANTLNTPIDLSATSVISSTAGTLTVGGQISGAGGLTKDGAGTAILTAANSYSGATLVQGGGALRITNAGALGNTTGVTLNVGTTAGGAGTTLSLDGGITVSGIGLTMNATNPGDLRTTINSISGNNTWDGPITLQGNGTAQFTTAGNLTLAGPVTGNSFTGTMFVRGGTGTGTINGTVNIGSGTFAKTDGGTWNVNSTNNLWGNTLVAVGTVRLGSATALPSTTVVTMGQNDANAATLDLNGFSFTVAGITSNPTAVGANTTGKLITSPTAATLTVNDNSDRTYAGVLGGALSLVKNGTGILTLSGANTYTGTTTINGGAISISADNNLGAAPAAATPGSLTLNGGRLRSTATFTLNANRGIALNAATNTIEVSGGGLTYNGQFSGANGLIKSGGADLIFGAGPAAANPFTSLLITGGRVFYTNSANIFGAAPITIQNGGSLNYNNTGADFTLANAITMQAGANLASRRTGTLTLTGVVTLPTSGLVSFNFDDQSTGGITMNNAANASALTGDITFRVGTNNNTVGNVNLNHLLSGDVNLIKQGGGTLTLTNSGNTFGGAGRTIEIQGGNLSVSTDAQLGNVANTITFTNAFSQALNLTSADIENRRFDLQTGVDNFSALWLGTFTPAASGDYSFGTDSDDGSTIFIDLNNDGTFDSPSERIVNNNGSHGTGTPQIGTAAGLVAGTPYRIAIATFQGTGGGTLIARFAAGAGIAYASQTIIDPSAAAQAGLWGSIYGPNTFEERAYDGPPIATAGTPGTGPYIDPLHVFPGLLTQAPIPTGYLQTTATFATSRNLIMNAQGGINASANTLTYNGTITTASTFLGLNGGFTKQGGGTVVMGNNAQPYTGPTAIRGGVLQVSQLGDAGSPSALGNTSNAAINLVLDGGTLRYNGTTAATTDRAFTLTTANGTIENNSAAATSTLAFASAASVLFLGPGAHTLNLNGSNTGLNEFNLRLSNDSLGNVTTLQKNGGGTWTVTNGANDYTGLTLINGGTLRVTNPTALGAASVGTRVNPGGGTLSLVGDYTIDEPISITGGGIGNAGALVAEGNITINNSLGLGIAASSTIASASGTLTIDTDLVKEGAADVTFTGGGNITVTGSIGDEAQPVFANVTGRLFLATGLGVANDTGTTNINTIALTAAPNTSVAVPGPLFFPSNSDNAITAAFGGTTPLAANFTAAFVADMTISVAGQYSFAHAQNDDAAAMWVDLNQNGTFEAADRMTANTGNGNTTTSRTVTLAPGVYKVVYVVEDTGGGSGIVARYQGPVVAAHSSTNNMRVVNGIEFPGGNNLIKTGAGTLRLEGDNTYSGATHVVQGTLVAASDTALGEVGGSGIVTLTPGFSTVWQVGTDNGSQSEFVVENGNSNAAPGQAGAVVDDDWYFAGTYPAPIGTLAADDPFSAFERAATGTDGTKRIHFNLRPSQLNDNFRILLDTVSSNFTGGDVPIEILVNGVRVHVDALSTDRTMTTATFNGADVGLVTGDNVVTITRKPGGTHFQMDYIRLESQLAYVQAGTLIGAGATLAFDGGVAVAAEPVTAVAAPAFAGDAIHNISGDNSFAGTITTVSDSGVLAIGSAAGTLTLSGNVNTGANQLIASGAGDIVISGKVSGGSGDVSNYASAVLDIDALRAYWRFNETADELATDYGPFGFNGTYLGAIGYGQASQNPGLGTAIAFNGTNTYVPTAPAPTVGITNSSFTASAWVFANDVAGDKTIFGTDAAANNLGLHLIIRAGKFHMGFYGNDTGGTQTISTGQWYHVVFRYDMAAQQQSIYVNGALDAQTGGHGPFQGTNVLNIGRWNSTNYFNGLIDEPAIFNRALSPTEIQDLFNQGAGTSPLATALVKNGEGTLVLAGANDYVGATEVNDGELIVDGSIASNVTVNTDGLLGGGGTINGNVSGDGTVAPGNGGAGVLTINGNLTSTGTLAFDVNPDYLVAGTDYDRLVVNSALDLTGATIVLNGGASPAAIGQQITIISNTSGAANVPSLDPAEASFINVGFARFQIHYNAGDGNDVVLTGARSNAVVYVDDSWAALANGTTVPDGDSGTAAIDDAVIGDNAFATLAAAIAAAPANGLIIINHGTYGDITALTGTQTLRLTGENPTTASTVTIASLGGIAGTTINLNGNTLTVGDNIGDSTIAGAINGPGRLVKQGTDTLTLQNSVAATPLSEIVVVQGVLTLAGTTNIAVNGTVAVGRTVGGSGTLNVQDTATLSMTNEFNIGDANGAAGNVNQSGGTVTVSNRVRLAHWPNNISTYNKTGGSLAVTNALNVGWDGTGIFIQTGGSTTAAQVLVEANGDTGGGPETITISGGTLVTNELVAQGSGVINIEGTAVVTVNGSVGVGRMAPTTSTLNIRDTAQLTITNELNIGDANGAAGVVNQFGGTVQINNRIRNAHWPNNISTYNLSGGALNITNALNVGWDGIGVFNMTGGTATAAQVFIDGNGLTGPIGGQDDLLSISGGTLNITATGAGLLFQGGSMSISGTAVVNVAGVVDIGASAAGRPGVVNHMGGTLNVAGAGHVENSAIRLGHWPNETSEYNLSGGTLNITSADADLAIATDGNGIFRQTGGTFNTPGIVVDHRNDGGTANLIITGGNTNIGGRGLIINSDSATIGGNANVISTGSIGVGRFGTGTLTVEGSAQLRTNGELLVGDASGFAGVVNQNGGTVTIDNRIRNAHWPNNVSSYNLSAGTLNVVNALNVGWDGVGVFNQSGGTANVGQLVIDGNGLTGPIGAQDDFANSTGGTLNAGSVLMAGGSWNISGGALVNVNGTIDMGAIGAGRPGTINQSGGTVNVAGNGQSENAAIRLGHWPTELSTYNLSGGALNITHPTAGLAIATDGDGVFNMTGGTASMPLVTVNHRNTNGSATFTLTGGTFSLGSGGFQTAGGTAAINLGGNGGTLRATANFTSQLPINLVGTGASAINVDTNGNTVTFGQPLVGGGGLTKVGPGTLALNAANTYGGATLVTGGTLAGDGSVTSAVTVNNGGTLAPGGTPGDLATGNLVLNSGGIFAVDINNTTPVSGHDQLVVTGTVTLNNATLTPTITGAQALGNTFVLIRNDGTDAVNGTFNGIGEYGIINVGGVRYHVTYTYNAEAGTPRNGNDVALIRNSAPVAAPDNFVVFINSSVSGNVKTNDTDGEGDAVVQVQTGVAHGVLNLNTATGAFTYTPTSGYVGPDSFTYRLSDGEFTSSIVTVAIDVQPVALTPSLSVSPASGNENTPIPLVINASVQTQYEELSIVISGLPAGTTLNLGTPSAGGTVYTLSPADVAQIANLRLTKQDNLPANAPFTLTVTAISRVAVNNTTASATANLVVTVRNVNPVPSQDEISRNGNPLPGTPAAINSVAGLPIEFTVSTTDQAFDHLDAPFTFTLDWGDGTVQTLTATQEGQQLTFTHDYAANRAPASFQPTLKVVDKDGGETTLNLTRIDLPTVTSIDGVVYVSGSDQGERIILAPAGGGVSVRINNKLQPTQSVGSEIVVFGFGGNDTITVATNLAIPVQFHGGDGDDYLAGGIRGDLLSGGPGKDRILGGGGDDLILGGDGNDTLNGDASNDTIRGDGTMGEMDTIDDIVDSETPGHDTINGGVGNDTILAGPGNDKAYGGTGNDYLRGNDGNDLLDGGAGNDLLLGDAGADGIYGRAGKDVLIGGAGADTIYGSTGADLITGNDLDSFLADDDMALADLWALWTSGQSQDAMDTLTSGGAIDDDIVDVLHGEGDSDWYLLFDAKKDNFKLASENKAPNNIVRI